MFWRMAGLSTASPVETILDKENSTLEELLDEDEIIQECKALNGRLINYLREKSNVKKLIQYIVEEAPEGADKQRTFKFPFISCEIFTCEVDIILKTLVEDGELMDLLFSFLDHDRYHSTLLAGYFSKVVVCLLLRKTTSLLNYIKSHQDIISRLVDLIGITSIMEVLIRLFSADEHIYANYAGSMQWFEDINVLEMIVDKFSSSDCAEVHANAAETLCAISRCAPPGLASKISSPSFLGRFFCYALEESRPKTVLISVLSVCIALLDPRRLTSGTCYMYARQMTHGPGTTVNPEAVQGMLENLGNLLRILDISSEDHVLPTTYGKLQPPLGKHRLKIVEFISVLVGASSEVAEKELIRLGVMKHVLELFFEYPYNNLLHHQVEHIIISCLQSQSPRFIDNILHDCDLIGRILDAENNPTLAVNSRKPTIPAEERSAPRIGNIGHLTRIANKLGQLGNSNETIQAFLQEKSDWVEWQSNVLLKRNALENVFQWACGRPTALHNQMRDSDDDDYQDKDFDVATSAINLSQAFQYGIYSNNNMDEARGSLEHDDEDVYFDDESAEVVISSLRLRDDRESGSLFTNSNWFAFEDGKSVDEPPPSSSPKTDAHGPDDKEDSTDTASFEPALDDINNLSKSSGTETKTEISDSDKSPVHDECTEVVPSASNATNASSQPHPSLSDSKLESNQLDETMASPTSADSRKTDKSELPDPKQLASIATEMGGLGN